MIWLRVCVGVISSIFKNSLRLGAVTLRSPFLLLPVVILRLANLQLAVASYLKDALGHNLIQLLYKSVLN